MAAACGQETYSQQSSDPEGNVQSELKVAQQQSDYKPESCNMWLCKGRQFADVPATNVKVFTAGQVVSINITIPAPYTGIANVSIVATASNTVLGGALIYLDDYASVAHTMTANNTEFEITMPDLGTQCAQAGDCVLQWVLDAKSVNQTFESCVDFTMA